MFVCLTGAVQKVKARVGRLERDHTSPPLSTCVGEDLVPRSYCWGVNSIVHVSSYAQSRIENVESRLLVHWASLLCCRVLWTVEPSLLSTVSVTLLLVTLLDYLVPALSASLCDPTHWTAAKERSYEQICATVAHTYTVSVLQIRAFRELKISSPKLVSFCHSVPYLPEYPRRLPLE